MFSFALFFLWVWVVAYYFYHCCCAHALRHWFVVPWNHFGVFLSPRLAYFLRFHFSFCFLFVILGLGFRLATLPFSFLPCLSFVVRRDHYQIQFFGVHFHTSTFRVERMAVYCHLIAVEGKSDVDAGKAEHYCRLRKTIKDAWKKSNLLICK